MVDLLLQDCPLTQDELDRLQNVVVQVARRRLVGRRFIDVYGPLGPGVQTVKYETYTNATPGALDFLGESPSGAIAVEASKYAPIPIIYKDFQVHWRDLEASRRFGIPLDTSAAAGAAAFCAAREDMLIFHGEKNLGIDGLLTVEGANSIKMGAWDETGKGFADVVQATRVLHEAGHYGPYAMVLSPGRFAALHRVFEQTGVLEVRTVRDLATDGIFQTDLMTDDRCVIVATGQAHFDLALSLDLRLAYVGEENLNLMFRVLECALLRIKHPDAICVLEGGGAKKTK
jgi:uncharacterized linocin/CFP29 family protein